ncbi:hypothetical protein D477_001549 [Arthrobacter crystallopoietes BAB-32]|uniref:Uncharacterized protein n=1 Tax=Arthrobacter crystallopoietes BAB-32 TaxID=1246476 RepID=N1V774_9MICC|nr:DUF4157 domain-containing protein [Arthrobacter crystallopoietes]EMY35962.1 hypothetical protein D477_001549 [Arthrobacter crystallopoietes BAB-32]
MTAAERLRRLLNWINLSSLLGIGTARLARCTLRNGPRGLIIADGYSWPLPKAAAFTLGNVVLFRSSAAHLANNPALLRHEARHSSQYAACLGLPFLPLYFAAAGWSLLRTGDPASRNPFERHAGLHEGGYTERPLRSRTAKSTKVRWRVRR